MLLRVTLALLLMSLSACAPPEEPCFGSDGDLAVLTQMRQVLDLEYYGGTLADGPVVWASGPTDAYAFVRGSDRTIYFVTPNFRHDWQRNRRTLQHEMSHLAVGVGHDHDAIWAREFRRLQRSPVPIELAEIRRAARRVRVARR